MQPNTDPIDRLKGTVTTIIQHATGSQAQVRHIQEWGIGALNKCYKVEVLAPGKTFFLKIENEDILPSTRRGQIEREVYSLRLMAQAGIPCPQMIDADCTRAVAGCKYMLEDFIDAQLFWEIKDELSSAEKEELKNAISQVLAGMQAITSPLFGDLYPGGAIGQYRSWPEAYIRMAILLLDDACQLAILQPPEQDMVEAALKRGAARLTADQPAGFYHGDLGLHNLLVSRADGLARLGQVIDFGNALYVPLYANEHYTRLYGGFGLAPVDVSGKYGIQCEEMAANDLLFNFEGLIFGAMLCRLRKSDPRPQVERFLTQCQP